MIYLDYSATTFVNKTVLNSFVDDALKYKGNPNSSHELGVKNNKRIQEATKNIAKLLNVKKDEIIYTSGSSESNNLAIKGVCNANKGKHIITTVLEHSSVIAPINRLCKEGYEVSFVKLDSNGMVDLEDLQSKIRDDTVLVSIVGVDSELGIKQNIDNVGKVLKNYPNCLFHVDATQMIGKVKVNFDNVDLISFSAHKFFGIKGIGCLIKKEHVKLEAQIDGGNSVTKYRSGTPQLELIVSLEKALTIAYNNFDKKLNHINKVNRELKKSLSKYSDIVLNSTPSSIDQIVNISTLNVKSDKLIRLLNEKKVYVSSKSACSSADALSKAVMSLYNDEKRADNSIRISISYVTTLKEIRKFEKTFDECYKKLGGK